jgi:hypothetical protein
MSTTSYESAGTCLACGWPRIAERNTLDRGDGAISQTSLGEPECTNPACPSWDLPRS